MRTILLNSSLKNTISWSAKGSKLAASTHSDHSIYTVASGKTAQLPIHHCDHICFSSINDNIIMVSPCPGADKIENIRLWHVKKISM